MEKSPQPTYETLLAERIAAGQRLMRALVHSEALPEIDALWAAVVAAEAPLWRDHAPAYERDYYAVVAPAEDEVHHLPDAPGASPPGDCPWCARRDLAVADPIPLPASTLAVLHRRSA